MRYEESKGDSSKLFFLSNKVATAGDLGGGGGILVVKGLKWEENKRFPKDGSQIIQCEMNSERRVIMLVISKVFLNGEVAKQMNTKKSTYSCTQNRKSNFDYDACFI